MRQMILRNPKFYAIQNGLAALVFAMLVATETLSHLLHSFPGVELFWRLTIATNRVTAPLLDVLGRHFAEPALLWAVLVFAALAPLVAYRHRSWIGTAICGHVALGAVVLLTYEALRRANTGKLTADLSEVFDPRQFDSSSMSLALATLVLTGLCLLNHVAFFAQRRSE